MTPTCALLIHGLGGTEYDLGALKKRLKTAGMDIHSLTLPGHGRRPQDLCGVRVEDWLEAVTKTYRELSAQYEMLHVIGMCMGALLAIELVKREDHRHGTLVALAAPVFIDGWATPWYREVRRLLYRLPGVADRMRVAEEEPYGLKNEQFRSIVKTRLRRRERFHYAWVPLSCIREVDRLRRMVMRGLDRIRCQTLIMHAREDELTSLRSAHFLARRIGAAQTRLEILENSYHMICVDNDREQVASSVLKFLAEPAHATHPSATSTPPLLHDTRHALRRGDLATIFQLGTSRFRWHHDAHGLHGRPLAGKRGLQTLSQALPELRIETHGQARIQGSMALWQATVYAQGQAQACGALIVKFCNAGLDAIHWFDQSAHGPASPASLIAATR